MQPQIVRSKVQQLVYEIQDATVEGISIQGQNLNRATWGRMAIRFPEFGMYMKNGNKQQQQFLSTLYEMYDCKIPAKIIKSEDAIESITNIPINVLAYSDYTIFQSDIKSYFETLMLAGFGRRFTLSFQPPQKLTYTSFPMEEEQRLYRELENLGENLFYLFKNLPLMPNYKLTVESKNVYNEYQIKIIDLYNAEENSLRQTEILSRPFKALKLSCLYACLNHPEKFYIDPEDMRQAISTIETLSIDFKKFFNYRPETADKYEKIYDFFKQNIGKEFTKTGLVKIFCGEFGFKRELLRKNFDDVYAIIQEIAIADGYIFKKDPSKCTNGVYYSLQKHEPSPLSEGTHSLDAILNQSTLSTNSVQT